MSLRDEAFLQSIVTRHGRPTKPSDTSHDDHAPLFIAEAPSMRDLRENIRRVAESDSAVLITGESGTGKDVVAREIARLGSRRRREFIPVNCGAIADSLVDSELFGHRKGAFTDAISDRKGLIEAADGGVLFLDEIGEMPPSAQTKLLRFLDSGEFRRVGESDVRRANVRVIAATNRNLMQAIDEGTFRMDLFYRLCVVALHIPPLRDRRSDIAALAAQHLRRTITRLQAKPRSFSADAMSLLERFAWPGNVRELQNVVERVAVLAVTDTITESDVQLALMHHGSYRGPGQNGHRAHPLQVVHPPGGALRQSQTATAAALGISRTTLWRRRRRDPKLG